MFIIIIIRIEFLFIQKTAIHIRFTLAEKNDIYIIKGTTKNIIKRL